MQAIAGDFAKLESETALEEDLNTKKGPGCAGDYSFSNALDLGAQW